MISGSCFLHISEYGDGLGINLTGCLTTKLLNVVEILINEEINIVQDKLDQNNG